LRALRQHDVSTSFGRLTSTTRDILNCERDHLPALRTNVLIIDKILRALRHTTRHGRTRMARAEARRSPLPEL